MLLPTKVVLSIKKTQKMPVCDDFFCRRSYLGEVILMFFRMTFSFLLPEAGTSFFPIPGLITIWQYSKLVGKAEIANMGS